MPPRRIKGLEFDNVHDRPLLDIWLNGKAFNAFRGTEWMKEPCRSCAFKEIDFGGCRCQAMAITGDARNTDPACALSPYHGEMVALARAEAAKPPRRSSIAIRATRPKPPRSRSARWSPPNKRSLPLPSGESQDGCIKETDDDRSRPLSNTFEDVAWS